MRSHPYSRIALAIAICSLFIACGDDGGAVDSGPADSGVDAGPTTDSGTLDTGAPDSGAVDTGARDTGAVDTGAVDTGAPDTGTVDAGVDAGADTGLADSGSADGGDTDAGALDSGATEQLQAVGVLGDDELVAVDLTTGSTTSRGVLSSPIGVPFRLGYDPATQTVYALMTNGQLWVLDPCDATGTLVGSVQPTTGNLFLIEGMAFNPNDNALYISGSADGAPANGDFLSETLFTVSTTTALATPIATISGTWQTSDADNFGWIGTQAYLTDGDGSTATHFHTFDVATGVATDLGAISGPVSISVPMDGSTAGNIFTVSGGQLYEFELATRVATPVGSPRSLDYRGLVLVDIACPL